MTEHHIRAARTGSASAATGAYANSGVHIGDVNLHTGAPIRTHYRHQVQRIAPQRLVDRDAELAELAEFCTAPDTSGTYRWWQAGAWSGKTALLSWFVLHPPPGVRVLSFFITARLAGQNNRSAFLDNLLEQLLALLGESLPPFLTESTREPHLLAMLETAAQLCRERDEHLVLLVDGLDEDRGVTTGPEAHSIAALLPAELPFGMRVIVAGRPNPPVPADVPPHHPLHRADVVRPLAPSPKAQAIRHEMERDLHGLLRGSELEQDLLGLITAAGGGLTRDDLVELTGGSAWEVGHHLTTVSGRSFANQDPYYHPETGPDVYLLGHEELQVTAQDMLGPRLGGYRERLHGWASGWRERGWPEGTPEYLVRGYSTTLLAAGELERLTALVTDVRRQERLHEYAGSDSPALAEIVAVLAAQVERESPDLTAITRLAIHRDHINDRHNEIPPELPAAWAMLGQLRRAKALLELRGDSNTEGHLLVAEALLDRGDLSHATELLQEASQLLRGAEDGLLLRLAAAYIRLGDPATAADLLVTARSRAEARGSGSRQWHTLRSAEFHFQQGETERAAELISSVESGDPADPDLLISVAGARLRTGDRDGALALISPLLPAQLDPVVTGDLTFLLAGCGDIGGTEALLPRIAHPAIRAQALALLTEAHPDQGDRWLIEATALTQAVEDNAERSSTQVWLIRAWLAIGELTRAEAAARAIEGDPAHRAAQLTVVAKAHWLAGSADRALALVQDAYTCVRTAGNRFRHAETLLETATASINAGDRERAVDLIRRAESLAWDADRGLDRGYLAGRLAAVLVEVGELDKAEVIIARALPEWRDEVAELVISRLIDLGELSRAQAIARAIPTGLARYSRLLDIADAAPAAQSVRLIEEVAAAFETIEPEDDRDDLAYRMVTSMARHPDPLFLERAVATARGVADDRLRIPALSAAALGRASHGDKAGARALLAEAQQAAAQASLGLGNELWAWIDVVTSIAALGDLDHAEALALSLSDAIPRNEGLAACVAQQLARGDLARAEHLTRCISPSTERVRSLLRLAEARPDQLDRLVEDAEQATTRPDHSVDIAEFLLEHDRPEWASALIAGVIQQQTLDFAIGVLARVMPSAIDTIQQELAVVSGR